MNSEAFFGLTFIISFMLGVLMLGGIEILIERRKAYKRNLKRLKEENKRLNRVISLYELELKTKEL